MHTGVSGGETAGIQTSAIVLSLGKERTKAQKDRQKFRNQMAMRLKPCLISYVWNRANYCDIWYNVLLQPLLFSR